MDRRELGEGLSMFIMRGNGGERSFDCGRGRNKRRSNGFLVEQLPFIIKGASGHEEVNIKS